MANRTAVSSIIICMAVLLVAGTSTVWANNTVWIEGIVTQGPWTEQYRHIEVNGVKFTLMSDATIYERSKDPYGGFREDPLPFNQIYTGQKLLILIQGHRIYQIVVLR